MKSESLARKQPDLVVYGHTSDLGRDAVAARFASSWPTSSPFTLSSVGCRPYSRQTFVDCPRLPPALNQSRFMVFGGFSWRR
jgi:hypothetical protein